MKLVYKESEATYTAKNGKEYHYTNYYLLLDNGSWIAIKPAFTKDYAKLTTLAIKID